MLEASLLMAYSSVSLSSHCASNNVSSTNVMSVAVESSSFVVVRAWLRNGWRGMGSRMTQGRARMKRASSLRGLRHERLHAASAQLFTLRGVG